MTQSRSEIVKIGSSIRNRNANPFGRNLLFFLFLLFSLLMNVQANSSIYSPSSNSRQGKPLAQYTLFRKTPLIHKSEDENQRIERQDGIVMFMYGSINATFEYYAAVEVGTEEQLFLVQVDTGSSGMAIPAKGCKQLSKTDNKDTGKTCGHTSSLYDSSKSKTSRNLKCSEWTCDYCGGSACEFVIQYGDGSFIRGPVTRDSVSMAGLSAVVEFGSMATQSENFENEEVDGILGMAYQQLDTGLGSVFESFVQESQCGNAFSMCLGYNGGVLVLGGVNDSYSAGPMVYTPIIEETYFVVGATGAYVNNSPLSLSSSDFGKTIVDSGTTLLILAETVYSKVVNRLIQLCPVAFRSLCQPQNGSPSIFTPGICSNLDLKSIQQFPTIGFSLQNTSVFNLGPEDYFLRSNNYYCFGLAFTQGLTILGDVFMQKYNILFDKANKRIGLAPAKNCEPGPVIMTLSTGDLQTGSMFYPLPDPLVVEVRFADNGLSATGVVVEFTVVSGPGKITKPRSSVDPSGLASSNVKITGTGLVTVKASVLGFDVPPVEFKVTGKVWVPGVLIGIVLGMIVIFAIGGFIYYYRQRRKRHQGFVSLNQEDSHSEME